MRMLRIYPKSEPTPSMQLKKKKRWATQNRVHVHFLKFDPNQKQMWLCFEVPAVIRTNLKTSKRYLVWPVLVYGDG